MKKTLCLIITVIISALSSYALAPDAKWHPYVIKGASGKVDSWANNACGSDSFNLQSAAFRLLQNVSIHALSADSPQTITAVDTTRSYGDADFDPGAFASSGLPVSYTSADSSIATVTDGKISIHKAGSVVITVSQDGNDDYSAATPVTFTLTINKAPLVVTAIDESKIYDANAYAGGNGVSYAGFVNHDTATVLTGVLIYTGTAQGAMNVGSYVITPSGLDAANYDITYRDGTLFISKASLTIRASNVTKTYSGVGYTGGQGVIYSGFAGTENSSVLTGPVLFTGSSQGAIDVGTYTLTPYGRTSNNYDITYVDGTLTIARATLIITAVSDNKIYNGNPYSGGNGIIYTGFVNNENATVLAGTVAYSGTSQGAVNVGSYLITPSGLSAPNYTITFNNGALTITKAPLTITAASDSKVYDGIAYTGGNGVTYTGFITNDNASVLIGTVIYKGTSQGALDVGKYAITPSGLSAANYSMQYVSGSLSITKAALTVTADHAARCYQAKDPVFTCSYSGFVNNETANVISTAPVVTPAATASSVAGEYLLTPSGAAATNYTFSYVNGSLTIYNLPVTTITTPDGTLLCSDTSAVSLTTDGNNAYLWSNGDTGSIIHVGNAGTYSVSATDGNGCIAPAGNTVRITAAGVPAPAFSYETYCTGIPITFTNSTSGDMMYTWHTSDGQTSTETSPAITFEEVGMHTVTLTAAVTGCPNYGVSVSQDIDLVTPVAAIRLDDIFTFATMPVQVKARDLAGATYQWLPTTGLSAADLTKLTTTLTQSQLYYIKMSFASGCTTTDTLLVNVSTQKTFVVANAFTPNDDGVNDLLHVVMHGVVSLEYFEIYNRKGNRVFRTTDQREGWNGTMNGDRCAAGPYVWVARGKDYTGKEVTQSGSVTLIR